MVGSQVARFRPARTVSRDPTVGAEVYRERGATRAIDTLENPSANNQSPLDEASRGDGASEWIALEKLSQSIERVGGMVVCSDGLRKIIKTIERLSPFRQTVLIEGESGTGKELIARALHS